MPVPHLPPEILSRIFGLTTDWEFRRNLCTFALVSPQWRQVAQGMLWSCVHLNSRSVALSYLDACHTTSYGTRSLQLEVVPRPSWFNTKPPGADYLDRTTLLHLLRADLGLARLRIIATCRGAGHLPSADVFQPGITDATLFNCHLTPSAASALFTTTLQVLDISHEVNVLRVLHPFHFPQLHCNALRQLRISGPTPSTHPLPLYLFPLVSRFGATLTHLELTTSPTKWPTEASPELVVGPGFAQLGDSLIHLRHLVTNMTWVQLLAHLPAPLETWTMVGSPWQPFEEDAEITALSLQRHLDRFGAKSLRKVVITSLHSSLHSEWWNRLEKLLDARGIPLKWEPATFRHHGPFGKEEEWGATGARWP